MQTFREWLDEEKRIEEIINESGDEIYLSKLFNVHYYGHMRKFPMIVTHDNAGKAPTMKGLEKLLKGKNPDNVYIGGRTLNEIKKDAPGILFVGVSQSTGNL